MLLPLVNPIERVPQRTDSVWSIHGENSLVAKKRRGNERIEVMISPKGKKISKNGIEQRRLSQYIGTMPSIIFAPEDLELVKGGPSCSAEHF